MAFTHTYEYPVVADNSRVTHYEPVHFSFDFGTHNRHRFRIESQQTSDIFLSHFSRITFIRALFHRRAA